MSTVVHVTHEAVQKVGGIGAVLQGLITARAYDANVRRTILLGPLFDHPQGRLGRGGEVLYSSLDEIAEAPCAAQFREIEDRYGVSLVYGRRRFESRETGVVAHPEVILVDVSRTDIDMENRFKARLYDRFGIQSDRYESNWEYEQYVRIAEPGYEALRALLGEGDDDLPCPIIAHEFMGMPTALKAIIEGDPRFKTIFYAHEVATMRPLVEDHPGHDTMFYNVLEQALAEGLYVQDIFGPQDGFFKHALISRASECDNVFAVGDHVVREMGFLGPEYHTVSMDLVYNGVPAFEIAEEQKRASKAKLQRYTENLLDYRPDYVFTHVTRLVVSKGLWRDFRVLEHLDKMFAEAGLKGVLFLLSTQGGPRSPQEVLQMEAEYGWPVAHRDGCPDLVHGERFFYLGLQNYNAMAQAIKAVFVNQFGWDQAACGQRMPADMKFDDLRQGSDVEFGQSVYEPFGIAQLEPLSFGAICVITNVCGCYGFVQRVAGGRETDNIVVADYTRIEGVDRSLPALLSIGMRERDRIESINSAQVARQVFERLPRSAEQKVRMIQEGYRIASQMSWEVVVNDYFLPGLEHCL